MSRDLMRTASHEGWPAPARTRLLLPATVPNAVVSASLSSFIAAVLVLVLGTTGSLAAPGEPTPGLAEGVHPPVDRLLSRGIAKAKESIACGEYSQAIRFLDEVLGRNDDYFVELRDDGQEAKEGDAKDGPTVQYVGLKEAARQLICDLPEEGLDAYEAAYGPAARRMVESAISAGDARVLEQVVQRYFYTDAGYEAALLLARDEADAGRRMTAALLYDQLLEAPKARLRFEPALSVEAAAAWLAAGNADRSNAILVAAEEEGGRRQVEIAGRERKFDAGDKPVEWLRETVGEPQDVPTPLAREWVTFRGNAARNGEAEGGLPHMRVRWKVRLLGHPKLESTYEDFAADLAQSGQLTPVAAAPLAIGDVVLVRTPQSLLAVDFETGKRIWRTEPQREPQLDQLIAPRTSGGEPMVDPEPARAFKRRMWEDYLYGTTSSDGARAFVIRDLSMATQQGWEPWPGPFAVGGGRSESGDTNRLCAYDLATQGKLVWEIDGAATSGELSGAFFLGAPLAVGQTLYVLAEARNRVYLAALDGVTGAILWRQQLVDLEVRVTMNAMRRLQAAMPSYEGGLLVCPTGAGIVVAVDAARHSLAWAYRYESSGPRSSPYESSMAPPGREASNQWLDAAVVVSDGRVLLTPPESEEMHCLDLRTGKLLWKAPRGDMQRLACVSGDHVLLVGERKLKALSLEDGKPAWRNQELALGSEEFPSGSGFLSEGNYYLPLTTGEVIAIDVAEGAVTLRATSHDSEPLGNLICHRGAVISNSGLFLDRFDQLEVLRKQAEQRLAAAPQDAEALRTMGEIAFNEGRMSEAVDLLERAYRADPENLDARDVLAECLSSALDEDFAAFRARLPLLKELDDGSGATRMAMLRIEAEGLLASGESLASARTCLAMAREARRGDETVSVGRKLQTTAARWVQAQLSTIWEKSEDADRAEIARLVMQETSSDGPPKGETLRRAIDFFGDLPCMEQLKLAWAKELVEERRGLEAQQFLLDLADSHDDAVAREATARVAEQLHKASLHSLSSRLDRELTTRWGSEPCLDGATGRDLVAKWQDMTGDAPLKWPHGRTEVNTVGASEASDPTRVRSPLWGVRWERCDSILGGSTALVSARGGELSLVDPLGREFFKVPLEQENMIHYRQAGNIYAAARGNLAVVSVGRQLAGVSTLPGGDEGGQPILWRANLGSNFEFNQPYGVEMAPSSATRPGSYRAPRSSLDGRWIGVIGPITSRGCVLQDQRRLMCVDPMTGAIAWSRSDVPAGCDLFGDSQYVLAALPGETKARVYGMVDGRFVREVNVPRWRDQLITIGRRVIRWRSIESGEFVLASLDPLAEKVEWKRRFHPNSQVDVEQGRYIAIVEPTGRATIIDGADGRTMVDAPIPAAARIDEVHLSVGTDTLQLVIKLPETRHSDRTVKPLTLIDSPVIDGQVFMFDRDTGEALWSRPAEIVQQALLLTQPVDLPFITFAGTLQRRDASGSTAGATMLILDKATGRTLFQSDDLPTAGAAFCVARVQDAAHHEAVVEMAGRTVSLKYTDERRPPEPPMMAEVESEISSGKRGLMGIFMKLGGAE